MTWSLNEIEALSRKAARGAGYAWGLAEDTGRAIRWLEARQLPGAAALGAHLQAIDGQDIAAMAPRMDAPGWTSRAGGICPILAGTMLADGLAADHTAPLTLTDLRAPLLLVPFLAWMSEAERRAVTLDLSGTALTLTPERAALATGPIRAPGLGTVTLHFGRAANGTPIPHGLRSGCDVGTVDLLTRFAARTYAPATEASRMAGAGAGLSDND